MPSPIAYQAATAGPGTTAGDVRYTAAGLPERVPASAQGGNNTPITVQVQAIDSKSFLDHSDAIAMAVRKAMLESHSLNSVVMDL